MEIPDEEPPLESEDCLRLNVYSRDLNPTEKMPVMFWIHGGALRYGSGDVYLPDGILTKSSKLNSFSSLLSDENSKESIFSLNKSISTYFSLDLFTSKGL